MSATLALPRISLTRFSTVQPAGRRRRPTMGIVAVAHAPAATRRSASLYEVLRVKRTATPREIKAAYRTMAKRLHPDVAGSAAAAAGGGPDFLEIHRAYATLSDPAARARYDQSVGRIGMGLASDAGFCGRRWETDQCW